MFGNTDNLYKKTGNRIAKWAGTEQFANTGKYLSALTKKILRTKNPVDEATFEQAVEQYVISKEDLTKRRNMLVRQSVFFLFCGIVTFLYGCYKLANADQYLFTVITLISVVLFSFSFRANFWVFQIDTRTLGASFKDWIKYTLSGGE